MATKLLQRVDQKETQELKHEIIEERVIEMEDGAKRIERTTKTKSKSQTLTQAIEREYTDIFQNLLLTECDNSPEALWRIQQKDWKTRLLEYGDYDKSELNYSRIVDNLKIREVWFKKTLKNNHDSVESDIIDNYVQEQGKLIMFYMVKKAWQSDWFVFDVTRIGLLDEDHKKVLRVIGVLTSKDDEQFDVALPVIAARKIVAHQSRVEQDVLERLIQQFKDQGIPTTLLSEGAQMAQQLSLHINDMNQENLKEVDNLIMARRFYWECQRRIQANHLEKYIDKEALYQLKHNITTHQEQLNVEDKIKFISSELEVLNHLKQTPHVLSRKDQLTSEIATLFDDWGDELYPNKA